jgi:hypothetical protein
LKYEALVGKKENKKWGRCGWKKERKEAVTVVQQPQPVQQTVFMSQPVVEYAPVYNTSEIIEERDKEMGDVVFAPAPTPSTLTVNNNQMI